MTVPTNRKKPAGAARSARAAAHGGKKRSAAAPDRKMRRVVVICASILLALLLLFLVGSWLVFSPYRDLGIPAIGDRHYQTVSRITSRTSSAVFRRNPPPELKLRLSTQEANDLLEIARVGAGFSDELPPPSSFSVSYRPDGVFDFVAPIDAAPEWFFGGKIYAEGSFRLEKHENKLVLEIPELRLGRFGVPIPGGGILLGNAGEEALKQGLPPELDAAIVRFHPETNGSLVFVCRPSRLLPILLNLLR